MVLANQHSQASFTPRLKDNTYKQWQPYIMKKKSAVWPQSDLLQLSFLLPDKLLWIHNNSKESASVCKAWQTILEWVQEWQMGLHSQM